ncbi:hypothetical protein [Yeosuana marina]|uniref:hypothetical protein n=1 Tax=Yeosuana marina TaxID=1565536 RepID=UPI0014204820|nr:hypothetical protein [Yeosuana marina]
MTPEQKEKQIQSSQNILNAIQGTVIGLESIYNHFDGYMDVDNKLDYVDIADGETEVFEDEANGLKDHYLPQAVKEAHNRYVALLKEWKQRTGMQLNELLQN